LSTFGEFDTEQFSREFQLSGTAVNQRLNWLLGLYYFDEEGVHLDEVDFTSARFLGGANIDNTSKAGFGQVTFDATEQLSLTVGLRYTDETKKYHVPDGCESLLNGPATQTSPTGGMTT